MAEGKVEPLLKIGSQKDLSSLAGFWKLSGSTGGRDIPLSLSVHTREREAE